MVQQFPGHHATIDNHDGNLDRAIIQHQATRVQAINNLVRSFLDHRPVDNDWQLQWRHIDGHGACLQYAVCSQAIGLPIRLQKQQSKNGYCHSNTAQEKPIR
jgi:hypothetical protein